MRGRRRAGIDVEVAALESTAHLRDTVTGDHDLSAVVASNRVHRVVEWELPDGRPGLDVGPVPPVLTGARVER